MVGVIGMAVDIAAEKWLPDAGSFQGSSSAVDMAVDRRSFIASSSAIAAAGIAGCSELSTLLGGPDPNVVDAQSGQSLSGALSGQITIRVLVENSGGTGDVRVEIATYDSNGNVLDRFEKVVEIEEGARRRVDMQIQPSSGAERYEATAEPA